MTSSRLRWLAAAMLLATLFVVACKSDKPAPVATPVAVGSETPAASGAAMPDGLPTLAPPAALVWKACGKFECSTLSVPMDYSNPSKRQIDLALVRLKARQQDKRIGSLLANPGGPGASGVDFVKGWAPGLSEDIRNRFDIVGFDPRGVGQSAPVECHDNLQGLTGLEPNPRTPEQWKTIEDTIQAFADLCAQRGGELLQYLGTINVARDMDRMRQALGDDKLTYFGYSYGTVLGQAYADTFPTKVRAIVVDGAVDTALGLDQLGLEQSQGFEGALQHWAADCKSRSCTPARFGDPLDAVKEVLKRAEDKPIPADADRDANAGETLSAVLGAMYTTGYWDTLGRAVTRGLAGDGTNLIKLVDDFLGRRPDGSYDNLTEMYNAVTCLDYKTSRDPQHYIGLADSWEAKSPIFGRNFASLGLYCAEWKTEPVPLKLQHPKTDPPILVVGTTGDPATPYKWAVDVAKQFEASVLLTWNGEGHTAYGQGDSCIDDTINTYLLDLKLPEKGKVCGDASKATPIKISKAADVDSRRRDG